MKNINREKNVFCCPISEITVYKKFWILIKQKLGKFISLNASIRKKSPSQLF
jgi:hypothetical protein